MHSRPIAIIQVKTCEQERSGGGSCTGKTPPMQWYSDDALVAAGGDPLGTLSLHQIQFCECCASAPPNSHRHPLSPSNAHDILDSHSPLISSRRRWASRVASPILYFLSWLGQTLAMLLGRPRALFATRRLLSVRCTASHAIGRFWSASFLSQVCRTSRTTRAVLFHSSNRMKRCGAAALQVRCHTNTHCNEPHAVPLAPGTTRAEYALSR